LTPFPLWYKMTMAGYAQRLLTSYNTLFKLNLNFLWILALYCIENLIKSFNFFECFGISTKCFMKWKYTLPKLVAISYNADFRFRKSWLSIMLSLPIICRLLRLSRLLELTNINGNSVFTNIAILSIYYSHWRLCWWGIGGWTVWGWAVWGWTVWRWTV